MHKWNNWYMMIGRFSSWIQLIGGMTWKAILIGRNYFWRIRIILEFIFLHKVSIRPTLISNSFIASMAPNYPDLPDSPAMSTKANNKKSKNKKVANSPLSTTSSLPDVPDFDKYEVRRAATGTGIFSSLFTISLVRPLDEIHLLTCYFFSSFSLMKSDSSCIIVITCPWIHSRTFSTVPDSSLACST